MKSKPLDDSKKRKDRACSANKPAAIERFLAAGETLLQTCRYDELTDKKISAAAASNDAMLHYYFGGKEGLVFELVVLHIEKFKEQVDALDLIDASTPNVTRRIFDILANAYSQGPWMKSLLLAEMAKPQSRLKAMLLKKYASKGVATAKLKNTLVRLVDLGIYRSDTDTSHAAHCMLSVILGSVVMSPFSEQGEFGFALLKSDEWLEYVSSLFDLKLTA